MELREDEGSSASYEGDLIRSFNKMTLEFSDIPVIKSKRRLLDISEITKVGELEYLTLYDIYTSWMNLNSEEKKKYRRHYQEALKTRSLVYIKKTSPESIPENVVLQFTTDDYDWEETDLVKTLEKMYFVYEPQYWKSFESHKFKYVGRGAPRYLFMGFIDWNIAKSKTNIEENFERIEDWLEAVGVSSEDSITSTDLLRDLVKSKGSYIDPITGRVMPKISLWIFFTQDQNPKRYTGGKFKALARDEDSSSSSKYDGSVNIITEDIRSEMQSERILGEIERAVEKSFEESVQLEDTPETIRNKRKIADSNRRKAIKKTFFEKPAGNYIYIGKEWSYPKINKKRNTINLTGTIPVIASRKKNEIIREKAKASLFNLKEIYDEGYLLPPLKRDATIITSKEELFKAIRELKEYNPNKSK